MAKLKSKQALVFLPRPNLCQGPINQRTNCISSIFLDFTSVTPFLHSYSIRARFLFRVRRDKLFSPSISTRWKSTRKHCVMKTFHVERTHLKGFLSFVACIFHLPGRVAQQKQSYSVRAFLYVTSRQNHSLLFDP